LEVTIEQDKKMFERKMGSQIPVNPNAVQKLRTAVGFESNGKYESALLALEEALTIQQNFTDAWLIKGVINGKLGKCNEALKCYEKAIEIDSQYIDAFKLKSATLAALGSHDKALECLNRAVELNPTDVNLRLNLADAYQRNKQFDESFRCYQEVKRREPNDPKIDYLIGVMWGNKADYEKALMSFEMALLLKHDFTDALIGKILILAKLGRNKEAKSFANKLLEIKTTVGKIDEIKAQSKNDDIRNQYNAVQKRFTSQYAPKRS
jgi:tetratricopeptide (TPR) repeat protein